MATLEQERPKLYGKERWLATKAARRRRRRRIAAGIGITLLVLGTAGIVLAETSYPKASLTSSSDALAQLKLPGYGSKLVSFTVHRTNGKPVPVRLTKSGALWPKAPVAAGETLKVTVVVQRPSYVSWLLGKTDREQLTLVAPQARPAARWLEVAHGKPVHVTFDGPVRVFLVRHGTSHVRRTLKTPVRSIALPASVAKGDSGSVLISTAPRTWERLSKPVRVSWFPAEHPASAIARPAPGRPLGPAQPIILTFAQPLSQALGGKKPKIAPSISGRWRTLDAHTIAFAPAALGFPLGGQVRLTLPKHAWVLMGKGQFVNRRALDYQVPPGSHERLEQLLAQAGYLPLSFTPKERVPLNRTAQLAAAITPPEGTWSWRWSNVPSSLRSMWTPGQVSQIDRGAIMAFQHDHDLAVDAFAGPNVWNALLRDTLAGKRTSGDYSYVEVTKQIPERLSLWHNGAYIYSAPANTGVPAAPTQSGTYPVFMHIAEGTMRGVNPNGTPYSDPGIKWISYFHGGDAIHGFPRGSYGTPQSVGCVELTDADAGRVWPYTPIGTLVTIDG